MYSVPRSIPSTAEAADAIEMHCQKRRNRRKMGFLPFRRPVEGIVERKGRVKGVERSIGDIKRECYEAGRILKGQTVPVKRGILAQEACASFNWSKSPMKLSGHVSTSLMADVIRVSHQTTQSESLDFCRRDLSLLFLRPQATLIFQAEKIFVPSTLTGLTVYSTFSRSEKANIESKILEAEVARCQHINIQNP